LHKNTVLSLSAPKPAPGGAGPGGALGEINSRALLAGTDRIAIRHGDCIYWLRATRQGKLLLTK
jgi:hemin uptake protein HemP